MWIGIWRQGFKFWTIYPQETFLCVTLEKHHHPNLIYKIKLLSFLRVPLGLYFYGESVWKLRDKLFRKEALLSATSLTENLRKALNFPPAHYTSRLYFVNQGKSTKPPMGLRCIHSIFNKYLWSAYYRERKQKVALCSCSLPASERWRYCQMIVQMGVSS